MLLLALDERARRTPLNYAATLQLRLQLLIFFFTGIRPSSLAQHKANSGFLQVQDVRVLQVARFQYGIELKVRNIKRFNTALSLGMQQTWLLQPTTKSQNAFIDVGAVCIPFLIERGVLRDGNRTVRTLADFLASNSSAFTCHGEEPLFLAGERGLGGLSANKPQRSAAVAENIASLCHEAGLPRAGAYAFRHDVGNFFNAAYGLEKARLALGHGLESDITRRSYSRDVTMLYVVGMRAEGEALDAEIAERLAASNHIFLRLDGYGVRAMAARLWSKAETDAEQAEPRSHRSRTHGQQRQDEAAPSEEQRATIEEDEELKRLEATKKEAEEALARGCEEHGCAPLAVRTVLASSDLPDTLRQLALLVQERRGNSRKRRQALTKATRNANKRELNKDRLEKEGVTVEQLQAAGRDVMGAGRLMASTMVRHATGASLGQLAGPSVGEMDDDDDDEGAGDQSPQEVVALAATLYTDNAEADDPKSAEEEVGPLEGATPRDVVIALMRMHYTRLQGRARLTAYLDWVENNPWHRCPLCPLPELTSTGREAGRLSTGAKVNRSHVSRHLQEQHPDAYAIWAAGGRMASAACFAPGSFVPSP